MLAGSVAIRLLPRPIRRSARKVNSASGSVVGAGCSELDGAQPAQPFWKRWKCFQAETTQIQYRGLLSDRSCNAGFGFLGTHGAAPRACSRFTVSAARSGEGV